MSDDFPAAVRPSIATGLPDDTLEEINRLWTIVRAFSNTAHDVNNAIQVVAGNAELLEARDLDPAVRRRIEVIRTEAARASTTINRLLAYSREPRIPGQVRDLRPFVESAVEMRLASASRRRIVLTYERHESGACLVLVEGSTLLQILLDLLLTAEESVAGHRNAKVVVAVDRDEKAVVVRVTASAENGEAASPPERLPATVALTSELQLWAAAHLAVKQNGSVTATNTASGYELLLRMPAVRAGDLTTG